MRLAKTFLQYGVMWVLVFVMSAGPLPLGIPSAEAAPTITDTPGIANFFTPKLLIIFDTSRSMMFRPNDPNSDPSVSGQDWDPTITHPLPDGGVAEGPDDTNCLNKFCIGKRALSQTLPTYTARIDMGLTGYNQYYQLTKDPATLFTDCSYDQIAYGYNAWGVLTFKSFDDLTGTGTGSLGAASPVFPFTNPKTLVDHQTRKESVATGMSGALIYRNIAGASTGAGSTATQGAYSYDWVGTRQWPGTDQILKASLGGTCPPTRPGATDGSCSAAEPCDMYAAVPPEVTVAYGPFYTGVDQGPTVGGPVVYTRNDPPATYTFNAACGGAGPYTGTLGNCNLLGDCTATETGGPTPMPVGSVVSYNDPTLSPGPSYTAIGTIPHTLKVQLTRFGAVCP